MLHVHKEKCYKDKEAMNKAGGEKGPFTKETFPFYAQKPRKFRIL